MNSSFSVKFYLNKNKGKGEQFKIYGRLIHDRKKSEFATNYYIDENKWDDLRGCAKRDQFINDELSELEAQVNRIRRKLMDDEKPVSSRIIAEILKGDRKEKRSLLGYTDEHIEEITYKKQHAQNTLNHYKSSRFFVLLSFEFLLQKKNGLFSAFFLNLEILRTKPITCNHGRSVSNCIYSFSGLVPSA